MIQDGRVRVRSGFLSRTFKFTDDAELLAIVCRLINEGVAFVDEAHGWPPAAVVARFHDSGTLKLPFQAIGWRGPGEWTVREIAPGGYPR
jgi:hypothetical protein